MLWQFESALILVSPSIIGLILWFPSSPPPQWLQCRSIKTAVPDARQKNCWWSAVVWLAECILCGVSRRRSRFILKVGCRDRIQWVQWHSPAAWLPYCNDLPNRTNAKLKSTHQWRCLCWFQREACWIQLNVLRRLWKASGTVPLAVLSSVSIGELHRKNQKD